MDDHTHAFLQRPDGTGIIGGNAASFWNDLMSDVVSSRKKPTRSSRQMVERFTEILTRIPDVSTPGVQEITMDEIGQAAEWDQSWFFRVADMTFNTTNVYQDLKAAAIANMPKNRSDAFAVTFLFDQMLDSLHNYEQDNYEGAAKYNKVIYDKYGLTEELMDTNFEQYFDDESQLHRTSTGVLKQYITNLWNEQFAAANIEIMQDRQRRLALHFRKMGDTEKAIEKEFKARADGLKETRAWFSEGMDQVSSQLSQISDKISVPHGTFESDPLTYIALGKFAPTSKAWNSAVHQLVSGERTNALDIIKGWGPEGAEYVKSLGYNPKKKNKSSKKRPRKKKKASQCGTEPASSVAISTLSDDTAQTPTIQEEEVEVEASSAGPSLSRKGPAPPKKKGHRLNKFEQMMRAVDRTTLESTEKTVPYEPSVSADWNTLRAEVQHEFQSFRSRLEEANKDREFVATLIDDDPSIAELKQRVTDKTTLTGRRAGKRRPYVKKEGCRWTGKADYSTRVRASEDRPEAFDISAVTWPRLDGSVDQPPSSQNEGTVEDTEQDLVYLTPQEQFKQRAATVNLEECSTEGIEPELIEEVLSFIPSVEQMYGQRNLSVELVAGIMGGWDQVRSNSSKVTR